MLSKLITIADAWITAANPTESQKVLAEARYSVCSKCEYIKDMLKIIGGKYCSECGCPISKKIFSKQYSECPKGFWEEPDSKYYSDTQKKGKTLF
jgi:hypothetical protein